MSMVITETKRLVLRELTLDDLPSTKKIVCDVQTYAGLFDRVNALVWYCAGLIIIEFIILLIFKWKCPLTLLTAYQIWFIKGM